jgi:preprotein translocase subunit SecA
MRIFASERMIRLMETLGMEDGVPIEHSMVTKSIANAQKRVEGMHFDTRKNLLEYDDVMNQQRKAVYRLRRLVLEADPSRDAMPGQPKPGPDAMREHIFDLVEDYIVQLVQVNCPEKTNPAEWKVHVVERSINELLGISADLTTVRADRDDIMDRCFAEVERFFKKKSELVGAEILGQLSAFLYLQTIDARWKEHLQHMDHLRDGIHMRAYGQKDPKQEYKKEGFNMFIQMRARIRDEVIEKIMKAQISTRREESLEELERLRRERRRRGKQQATRLTAAHAAEGAPVVASGPRAALPRAAASATAPPLAGASSSSAVPVMARRPAAAEAPSLNRAQRRKQESQSKKKVKLK